MRRRLFGTDGVRGVANTELTPDLALALGRAATTIAGRAGGGRPLVVVGRDTRRSGSLLEDALCAGIASAGGVARRLGVVPTPGVAYMARVTGAVLGAVISASHNPAPDNGIKLFAGDGYKLDDDAEARIEDLLSATVAVPTGADVGWSEHPDDPISPYVHHLASLVRGDLSSTRIAFDCGHGAATSIIPRLVERLGIPADVINATPDGVNINVDCGSTHLAAVAAHVREHGLVGGIAFDGDADRCLAVTADGTPVDGDQIITALARDLLERDELPGRRVVLTSMSNLGAHRALAQLGVERGVADVGDRYVLAMMQADGATLGGEQSGHLISLAHGTTGDGVQSALLLLDALARRGETLADVARLVRHFPQRLISVRADRRGLSSAAALWDAVHAIEAELGDAGRVVLRASGTEPLVRVMVEAEDADRCERYARELAELVTRTLPLD